MAGKSSARRHERRVPTRQVVPARRLGTGRPALSHTVTGVTAPLARAFAAGACSPRCRAPRPRTARAAPQRSARRQLRREPRPGRARRDPRRPERDERDRRARPRRPARVRPLHPDARPHHCRRPGGHVRGRRPVDGAGARRDGDRRGARRGGRVSCFLAGEPT